MIHPSEYRIGNLVWWNPALTNSGTTLPRMQVEIASVHANKIGYFSAGLDHRSEAFEDDLLQTEAPFKSPDELEPIPVTAVIVQQAGFVNNRLNLSISGPENFLVFSDNEIFYQVGDSRALKLPVKYLHQLQNLYFTLTGEELKMNAE